MSDSRICPPPESARDLGFLRGLELDTMLGLVQGRLAAGARVVELRPDYVRWKDRDGSLLGFRATLDGEDGVMSTYVTARTAAPERLANEAERLRQRTEERHRGLRGVRYLPEVDLLLLAFPIDRELRDLRRLVRTTRIRNLVQTHCPQLIPAGLRISKSRSRHDIVRYKPERRAVLHWDLGLVGSDDRELQRVSLWIRCHSEPHASRTRIATVAAAAAGVPCPTMLGSAHERLLLESHVDGEAWLPFSSRSQPDAAAAAAATLARLHDAELPTQLPGHGPLAELDRVFRAVEDLDALGAELGSAAHRIADRLARTVPPAAEPVLAHGDMHPGQVLLRPGSDTAGLCDFDRSCIAPAAFDLAAMLAHCLSADADNGEAVADRFLVEYRQRRRLPVQAELAWWNACALVCAAMSPFRGLRRDWPEAARRLLRRAEIEARAAAGGDAHALEATQ
ncbi:MAG: phosphotransferase [Planctomycetes bacterium]|nr:phosphotransferase [Planctomycetota bacterium]